MKFTVWDVTLNITAVTKSNERPSYELISDAFKQAMKASYTQDVLLSEVEMRSKPIEMKAEK